MGADALSDAPASTSQWDAADYAKIGGFVPALGQAALELLDPQPGEHILDVGCGDGTLTLKIKEMGADVVGIDNSLSMVAAAKAKGLDARLMDAAGGKCLLLFTSHRAMDEVYERLQMMRVAGWSLHKQGDESQATLMQALRAE